MRGTETQRGWVEVTQDSGETPTLDPGAGVGAVNSRRNEVNTSVEDTGAATVQTMVPNL